MKKSILTLTVILFAFIMSSNAQVENCSLPGGSGGTLSFTSATACPGETPPLPTLSGYTAGLERTDYVFTNPNVISYNEDSTIFGPEILAVSSLGILDPGTLGLVEGDDYCVTAFSWNLSSYQAFVEELLNGSFIFVPCCDFAELEAGFNVCAVYNAAGYNNGSDVTDLGDVADIVVAFSGSNSIAGLLKQFDTLNLQSSSLPCVNGTPICYATSNTVCIDVECALSCNPAIPPQNPQSTMLMSGSYLLTWDPVPASLGCQVQLTLPTGAKVNKTVVSPEASSFTVPAGPIAPFTGQNISWKVRCACQISPSIIATGFSATDVFTVGSPRLAEKGLISIDIYPNPATTAIHVNNSDLSNVNYSISDMQGRILLTGIHNGSSIIDVSSLSSGLYLFEWDAEGHSGVEKILIRN